MPDLVTVQTIDTVTSQVTSTEVVEAGYVQVSGTTTDWINAQLYGADPTGTANSTTAIQNALNAATAGQVVYVPEGTYKTTAPLTIPPGVRLKGPGLFVNVQTFPFGARTGAVLAPSASFSGSAVVYAPDQATGGFGVPAANSGIEGITIDGSNSPASVDGIRVYGSVFGFVISDCNVWRPTGWGINAIPNGSNFPDLLKVFRTIVNFNGTGGVQLSHCPDSTCIDVYSLGGASGGDCWTITPSGNSHLIGCRGENAGAGNAITISGNPGYGQITLADFSSNLIGHNGIVISNTCSVVITGGYIYGAGQANTGYSAISITGQVYPVIIDGIDTAVAINGSSVYGPTNGLSIASSSVNITINNSVLWGASTAINDDATNTVIYGPGIITATGGASPTFSTNPHVANISGKSLDLSQGAAAGAIFQVTNSTTAPSQPSSLLFAHAAGDKVLGVRVSGDANSRLDVFSNGTMRWGPGGGTGTDTDLYRASAGVLETDGSLTVGTNLIVTGSATAGSGAISGATGTYGGLLEVTNTTSAPSNSPVGFVAQSAGDKVIGVRVSGDSVSRLEIFSNATIRFGPGGSTGTDTNLYRSSAALLKTDGSLEVGTNLTVDGTSLFTGALTLTVPLAIAQGGTGQTTASTAFNALWPGTALGDTVYGGTAGAGTRLAGNTTSTKNFLTQTGTGSASAAPAWGTIASGDLPAATTSTQGAVILDGTSGDIKATSTAAAVGSSGKAADASHVHAQSFSNVFGDGSDGSATLDGSATVAWASLAASTYTLTRDAYCTSLTINNGVTLVTGAAYRIFCQGTLTNNGTISADGNAGAAGGTAGSGLGSGTLAGSRPGGAGATGNGSSGSNSSMQGIGTAGAGGAGGTGSAGSAGTRNGSATFYFRPPQTALSGVVGIFNSSVAVGGGPGGGGGGGDGTNSGGGGGSGGGCIAIFAWAVNNGSGTISAKGGNGGTPAAGNAGGGGGGGGGLILVYTLSAWTAGTTAVTGGTHGTAHGSGSNGSDGGSGNVVNFVLA